MQLLENPVQVMADVTAIATYGDSFPKIQYWKQNFKLTNKLTVDQVKELGFLSPESQPHLFTLEERNPTTYDFRVIAFFPQLWGSTALGFGGLGGAAMTEAYTTVIKLENNYAVFFNRKAAYTITDPNLKFFEDLKNQNMENVKNCNLYN